MTQLSCAGRVVADYVVRPELALALSPRPYLHPVRTLAGITVTDAVPKDHPWHLGVGVALQHVVVDDDPPVNFWGGRTYQPEHGYQWLDDHGQVEHVGWTACGPSAVKQELAWRTPHQLHKSRRSSLPVLGWITLLRERRMISARPLQLPARLPGSSTEGPPQGWVLRVRFALENVTSAPVSLGSPGTQGRAGAGYGGFFWRAATSEGGIRVQTPDAEGEDAVHGHPAEWLIFGGNDPGNAMPWSLLLAGQDALTRADPWFVRTRDYPGLGSALAFEQPVELGPGQIAARSLLVAVLDGILDGEQASAVLTASRVE
jgi:Methane oxygenase PmoA